ncbi:MAG: urease accessory protein UreE [Xanthobacteraceae bacterium]|nr:urease accessory protein UreE [Xanthobacteraceae bacterium]
MIEIFNVLGSRHDPALAERLHRLEHCDALDVVTVPVADLARRRFLITSRGGKQLAIALPRSQKLFDGAVLWLDEAGAIVVRAAEERWLRLEPASTGDAIELGYHAGNLHWRVRFDGGVLLVALEGRPEDYTARLADMISSHRVAVRIVEGANTSSGSHAGHGDGGHRHSHDHSHDHGHGHGPRP